MKFNVKAPRTAPPCGEYRTIKAAGAICSSCQIGRNSMKSAIWALALVSLAGCAVPTMNEMRQETPREVLHSKKNDKLIAECVQRGWQNLFVFEGRDGATLESSSNGGYTVSTSGSAYFVDIQSQASGSEAKYYAATDRWISKKHLAALQSCL